MGDQERAHPSSTAFWLLHSTGLLCCTGRLHRDDTGSGLQGVHAYRKYCFDCHDDHGDKVTTVLSVFACSESITGSSIAPVTAITNAVGRLLAVLPMLLLLALLVPPPPPPPPPPPALAG